MDTKRPITTRALIQRIRRAAERNGQQFHVSRTQREREACGAYYLTENAHVCDLRLRTLEDFGKHFGCLEPWEVVED